MIILQIGLGNNKNVFVDSLTFHDSAKNSTVVINTKGDDYLVPVPGVIDEVDCVYRYTINSEKTSIIEILVPIINGRTDYDEDKVFYEMENYDLISADIYRIKKDSLNRTRKNKLDKSLIEFVKARTEKSHSWLSLYEDWRFQRYLAIKGLSATVTINSPSIISFERAKLVPLSGKKNITVEIVGSFCDYKKPNHHSNSVSLEKRSIDYGLVNPDDMIYANPVVRKTQYYMKYDLRKPDEDSCSVEIVNGKTVFHYKDVVIRVPSSYPRKGETIIDFVKYCFFERKNLSCYLIGDAEVYYSDGGKEQELPRSEDYIESIILTYNGSRRKISGRGCFFRP